MQKWAKIDYFQGSIAALWNFMNIQKDTYDDKYLAQNMPQFQNDLTNHLCGTGPYVQKYAIFGKKTAIISVSSIIFKIRKHGHGAQDLC